MRRLMGLGLLAVAVAFSAGCKGDPKLDGTYTIVGMERNGEQFEGLAKAPESERTLKIAGDQMIATKGGKEDPLTFKVDWSKKPAEINMKAKSPSGKEETLHGICKLEGDSLTICFVESDKPEDRPKEFKTSKDSKATILVLKKNK